MTVDELLGVSRMAELRLAERTINQRAEWQALRKIDRLEKQLSIARTRIRYTFVPETH